MSETAEETNTKLEFKGSENLFEVKEVLELRRIELAGVKVSEGLDGCGSFRALTDSELKLLFEATGMA